MNPTSPSRRIMADLIDSIENTFLRNIMQYVVRPSTFNEMIDAKCKLIDTTNYKDFFDWNLDCIHSLPPESYSWLYTLSIMIQGRDITQMDIDGCRTYPIGAFYFSNEGKLILVNFT